MFLYVGEKKKRKKVRELLKGRTTHRNKILEKHRNNPKLWVEHATPEKKINRELLC